jgi:hypothetical protein
MNGEQNFGSSAIDGGASALCKFVLYTTYSIHLCNNLVNLVNLVRLLEKQSRELGALATRIYLLTMADNH